MVDDADLLARLNAHCSTLLGSAAPASLSLEEDEVDGSDEGEWQGFDGETDGEEDGSELDDDTDLLGNVSKGELLAVLVESSC